MQTLGRYRVLRQVGSGGMGVVFLAQDDATGELVAIKRLHAADPTTRFAREGDALARLTHPAIVTFRERLTDPLGRPALVMEWVDGEALDARLRREGPLPLARAVELTRALCAALSHAHAQGVIHRDLKPSNLLLERHGALKVTDFGLSKVFDHTALPKRISLTKTGDIMGTPGYMPPEQATGDKAAMGPCSDVYGVGATLYALLTGQAPFRAPTVLNVLNKLLTEPASPPSSLRPEVPPALDAIVLRCLAKDPGDRYLSADALDEALATWERPPAGSRPRIAALAACALVVVGAGVAAWVARSSPQPVDAATSPHPDQAAPAPRAAVSRDDPAALRAISERALEAGRLDDALGAAERAIELDPAAWTSHACLARAHVQRCDDVSAISAWQAAIERAPVTEQPQLRLGLGRAYRYHKRVDDAQRAFEAGRAQLREDEDDALLREFDAELLIGKALNGLGQPPARLIELLEQSLDRHPTSLAHELRSAYRIRADDLESALADLDAAVDLAADRRSRSPAAGDLREPPRSRRGGAGRPAPGPRAGVTHREARPPDRDGPTRPAPGRQ